MIRRLPFAMPPRLAIGMAECKNQGITVFRKVLSAVP